MAYGKSIELFLVNGTVESTVTAELSNWNGKAIKIPRTEMAESKRDDLKGTGVYFLFCHGDDEDGSVYIGEAENVQERLIQHIRDYSSEKEKYYWHTAVAFIGGDLNKALIRYLEHRLVEIARACKKYSVLTKNTYRNTVMKEAQVAAMEEFICNIKILIGTLGYDVLEQEASHNNVLTLNIGNAVAKAVATPDGFELLAGSSINEKVTAKSLSAGMMKLRDKHLASDKVKDWITTENIKFSSPSAAACFVLGYMASGLAVWKDKSGKSLKDIEAEGLKTI